MLSDMNQVRSNKMKEIVDEYMSSLQDLNMNSKPHINMLTILAEDYAEYASAIVEAIEAHIQKVQSEVKLPILYLIDSIVKNVNGSYSNLFSKNIVSTFSNVFQKVDENTRAKMWKLRTTWGEVFPKSKLSLLDAQVHSIDPAWPLPSNVLASKSIHVNPKFLSMQQNTQTMPEPCNKSSTNMEEEFLKKQKELMDLQKQKLQLMMHQQQLVRPHIHVKPELIAPDGTLKKPILTNVPCNIIQSLENLTSVAPDVSTNRKQSSVPPTDSLLNGNVDIEKTHQQQPVLTKLESDGGSFLVSSSPVKSRDNDDALATPYSDSSQTDANADLSLIMNDNKCLNNDRIQRSSNSSQKTKATKTVTITCDAAQSKNSSERSPSKDSSTRASSSSLSLKQQQQQNSSSSSNSSSSTASRGSGKSWGKTSSSPSSSSHKQSSSKHKRSRSPKDHHHHHHHQQHHHHHHHHSPKLKQQALDEEEQFGGSLIVSPPQPIANVKRLRQRRDSSGGSAGSSRLRRKKERNSSSSRSPDSGREGPSKRRDSTSRDEDLRMTALASSVTATNNAAAAAAAKAAAAADVTTTTLDSKEDLDLRVLPMPTNKRQSTDLLQPPDSKKSKTEDLDNLFGKEDVDLRILNPPPQAIIQQPPTPPPPIISTDKDSGWAKFKTPMKSDSRSESSSRSSSDSRSTSDSISSRGSRDVRPNRAVKLYNKTSEVENKDRRRTGRDYDRNPDRNIEIIMKQAAEQLNQGTITKTQYNMLIQEVLHMSEDQKLRAAQRKERENKIWERNDKSLRSKEHGMHPRPPGGPRWQYPWPQPWAHPPGPFQGHFRPDFRPIGPWQNHPRLFGGPMRPDFHQFHAGFNPRIPHPPMGPNGPIILPSSPLNPMAAGALNALGGPIGPLPPGMIMGAGGPIIPKRPSPNSGEVSNESNSLTWTHQTFGSNDGTKTTESNEDDNVNSVSSNSDELPSADSKLLEEIAKDTMRSINIDNIPREIRYYGHTGIIFMHWNDPRDIGFQNGARRISIDGKEVAVCSFNDDYREFTYEGEVHRIKLGAPTRELYVDDNWYQCYFGGQPVTVDLGGKKVSVKLDGPPPQVKIGTIKRTDLVVGKINLIINARSMVPVFLDAKPQMFNIEGKSCTLEFIDALQTVLLNGRPFQVEFGGLPKPVVVHGKKHFIRFSGLPHGFRAGYVKITGMKGEKPKELPPAELENKNQTETSSVTLFAPPTELDSTSQDGTDQPYTSKSDLQLDVLSSVVPSAMAPSSGLSYQAEPIENTPAPTPAVTLPLNLSELFQRLVETGIVSNFNETKKPEEEKKDPEVIPVTFDKPETLKIKQPAMITGLYSGIQCSSCGARFAPEMATRYSHHLDWHFRQNRKERDSSRKAHSRLWYYDVSDWIQFEEIEDLEDRAQSWFETEKQTMESENAAAEELFAETMQPSVPTSSDEDACCQVCHEAFEQFYNDEKEEWHLRPAITFENKNFHPLCLEDHKRELEYMDETVVNPDASEIIKIDNEENINNTSEDPKEDLTDLNEICKKTETKTDVKEEISEQNNLPESVSTEVIDTIERKIEEIATDVKNEQTFAELKNENNQIFENETPEISKKDTDEKMEHKEEESNAKINVKDELIIVKEEPTEMDIEMEKSIAETSAGIDSTQVEVKTAIDGNVELESTVPIPVVQSKIKINIIKPINSPKDHKEINEEKEDKLNEEESPPSVLKPAFVKPTLQDRNLSTLPPVEKGEELSALCSIM